MSLDINQIIPVDINISAARLGSTNIGTACIFFADAVEIEDQGLNFFTSSADVKARYPNRDQLNEYANGWFRKATSLMIFGYNDVVVESVNNNKNIKLLDNKEDVKVAIEVKAALTNKDKLIARLSNINVLTSPTTFLDALNYLDQKNVWFYFPFLTEYKEDLKGDSLVDIAKWCESNTRFLIWPTNGPDVYDPNITTDDASVLVLAQQRRCAVLPSKVSLSGAIRAAAELATVNYSAINGYKDLEFKDIGQAGDDFDSSTIAVLKAKGAMFNVEVASKGSKTGAMMHNTLSTSSFGELVSEVIAIDNYGLSLQTGLFNTISSQKNFPQTPTGQQLLINRADSQGETAIDNGFLGNREYFNADKDEYVISRGYETLTVPDDIYSLSDEDRAKFKAAPIRQMIFKAGSVHTVSLSVNVQ